MPIIKSFGRLGVLLAVASLVGIVAIAGADAGTRGERVYADNFGNLVVLSPAGYKRIVVGRGYLAHRMQANRESGPRIVYLDRGSQEAATCHHHATLLHGRSYMYGLPDNVVPEPSAACW